MAVAKMDGVPLPVRGDSALREPPRAPNAAPSIPPLSTKKDTTASPPVPARGGRVGVEHVNKFFNMKTADGGYDYVEIAKNILAEPSERRVAILDRMHGMPGNWGRADEQKLRAALVPLHEGAREEERSREAALNPSLRAKDVIKAHDYGYGQIAKTLLTLPKGRAAAVIPRTDDWLKKGSEFQLLKELVRQIRGGADAELPETAGEKAGAAASDARTRTIAEDVGAEIQEGIEGYLPPERPLNTEAGPAEKAALDALGPQAEPNYRRAVAAAARLTPDDAARERLLKAKEDFSKTKTDNERRQARQELAAAQKPFSDYAVAAAYAAKLEAQGDVEAAREQVEAALRAGPRKDSVPIYNGASERLQLAEQRAKAAQALFAAAYADRYAAEREAKADASNPRLMPNWTTADADAYDLLQNEATSARDVARKFAATVREQQQKLLDLIDEQSDTKRSMAAILDNEIQRGPQVAATEVEHEYTAADPVTAALFRAAGIRLDPSDPELDLSERLALRQGTEEERFAFGSKRLLDQQNATPYDQRVIPALRSAAVEARVKYTVKTVRDHIAKNDVAGAIKILNTNLNATATPEERADLFDAATKDDATGGRYFSQAFFEKQIAALVANRPVDDGWSNDKDADRVGAWLLEMTKHSPPEVANPILDAVKAQFQPSWMERITTRPPWPLSGKLFSGLSQAVAAADRPVFNEPEGKRAVEIADWLTKSPERRAIIGYGVYPRSVAQFAIEGGSGARLSLELGNKIDDPNPPSDPNLLNDPEWHRQRSPRFYEAATGYMIDQARRKRLERAKAEYAEFKKDPDGIAKPYLDDVRAQASNFRKTLSAGPELRNFIGTVLRYNPNNSAAFQPGAPLQDWYRDKELELISKVERRIIDDNGGNGAVTVSAIPLLYAAEDAGVRPTALFGVERKDQPRSFVDDRGATYADWQDFLENNSFSPDGEFHLAQEMLRPGEKPPAQSVTPAHIVTGRERIEQGADVVLGTAAMAALFFGGPLTTPLLAVGGGWFFYRSSERLWNRGEHGLTLSLFDREARAEWLTLLGSGAGSLVMIGRFARFLPNSRATRGIIALGDTAAPYATTAGSWTIIDAGTNLMTPDLSPGEVVREVGRMALGTIFLNAGRMPSASSMSGVAKNWRDRSWENVKLIGADFKDGFKMPLRQLGRVVKWTAGISIGVNVAGALSFGGFYFGQGENRVKGSVGPQNASQELAKLRANPDAYLEANYEDLLLGTIGGIPLKHADGHLRRITNSDGTQYYYRRVPEDMFNALKAANPKSDKIFVNEMWKDNAGKPMPIWVEIRPPYREEPFRDANDVSGVTWAKDSEPGSWSARGTLRVGPLDGLTMNVGGEATWNYAYDSVTQTTARVALATRNQGLEPAGIRQQNTTPSWVFGGNINFIDINPAQAEDLTDPDSMLNGVRVVIFNNRVYLQAGRRDRLEANLPSKIGQIVPGDKNPMTIAKSIRRYGRAVRDVASGKGSKEIDAFARLRVTTLLELGFATDVFGITLPDKTRIRANTYNEFQAYGPVDWRTGVRRNLEAGRSWERFSTIEPFPQILADPALQVTIDESDWRMVPNLGQSVGHGWEPELGPASANWGAPTIGPLMPIEANRSLDASALIQDGVKQVAWRDFTGKGGAGWKIADHEGRRYLKAVEDVFDVTDYDETVLSRFDHQPAAGIEPAKLSLGQISLQPVSAVKPELSSTNKVSLVNNDGVLAQANGHTYVVVNKKDVFDVTGWRQTDLQSLLYEPADKDVNARLSPIGTFTLSPIALHSATAQSSSRQSLPGGGEAVFVTQGNKELVLYRPSAGAQWEPYDWTGYDRRTIEEWLQTR